ncbi:hypothetical protein Droror1_Dr00002625 [Drosera rotundifolia]
MLSISAFDFKELMGLRLMTNLLSLNAVEPHTKSSKSRETHPKSLSKPISKLRLMMNSSRLNIVETHTKSSKPRETYPKSSSKPINKLLQLNTKKKKQSCKSFCSCSTIS